MSGFETRKLSLLWVRLLFWLLRTSSTSCRDLVIEFDLCTCACE